MKRINTSFYLLILSSLVVGLVITSLFIKSSALATNIFSTCQKSVFTATAEISRPLQNILFLIIAVSLVAGLLSFLAQIIKTHIFLKEMLLKEVEISVKLTKILEVLNLKRQVRLVENRDLFSFCSGFFSPFIVISTGLVKSLTKNELEAVLLHEESHLVSRDPMKLLIGKTFTSMFFFLPIFRELHKNIEAVSELLADQWTIGRQKNSNALRCALRKILAAPQLNTATVSNVSGPDYFEIRIHRLKDPGCKQKFRLSFISLLTSFLFISGSFILLQTPVNASHMEARSDSSYLACSENHSCFEQCHHGINGPADYIQAYLLLPEKECD